MKSLVIVLVLLTLNVGAASVAPRVKSGRVPPPGLAVSDTDRAELQAGADELARRIDALMVGLKEKPARALLPDVQVFYKAVDWALRYDEFYRSNEVALARNLLKQGNQRARELQDGRPSWLTATGLVVRGYVSKIDGSVQPYGLVVPAGFAGDPFKPRRLDVWLHGRDNNLTELKFIGERQRSHGEFAPADTFVLHPYGRYCNAFKFAGEVDVFEAMEHAKRSYALDDRRIALRGFSMGGAGAWHLGAHHPATWAVVAPGAGFAETAEYLKLGTNRARVPVWEQTLWQLYDATDYAANFTTLPVIAYDGSDDPQRQAADVMERAMKAEGLTLPRVRGTNVGHKYTAEARKELSRFVDENAARGRHLSRERVRFTTRTLRYNQGLGVEVLGLGRHWQRADFQLESHSDEVVVTTTNITRFAVERGPALNAQRRWIVDGSQLNLGPAEARRPSRVLLQKNETGKWVEDKGRQNSSSLIKAPGLQGPIDDAFMGSFLIVRPTGPQNVDAASWILSQLSKATNEWRAQFRGDARVKDDSEVNEADIAAHHLILFGDPVSNRLLARMSARLPIKWKGEAVEVGERKFPTTTHVPVFIFPNPLNPERYVVVNSGFTFAAAGAASNAQQTPKLPDYAVLRVQDSVVELADFFDEQWRIR